MVGKSDQNFLFRVDNTLASCAACSGCGSLARGDAEPQLVSLPAAFVREAPPLIGDPVEIEATREMLLVLSLVVYLSPVILMLVFSVGCSLFFNASEAVIALSAVIGLALGLGAVTLIGGGVLQNQVASHIAVRRK